MYDSLDEAIYSTCHEFRGGAVRLAPRVGMNAGTLSNKANPGMESHQLGLRESIPIQRIADDYRILHAYAAALDHTAIPLGDFSACSDLELLELYAKYHARVGEMAKELHDTLADRKVTRREFSIVKHRSDEAVRANRELLSRLEALIDDE